MTFVARNILRRVLIIGSCLYVMTYLNCAWANLSACDLIMGTEAKFYVNGHSISGKIVEIRSPEPDQFYFRTLALRPPDGVGTILVYESTLEKNRLKTQLWSAVLGHPRFFGRLGIFADDNRLFIGNGQRLNWGAMRAIGQTGFELEDLPADGEQHYSQRHFFNRFLVRRVPLASRSELEPHDRIKEHILGSLFMPLNFTERLVIAARLLKKLEMSPRLQKNRKAMEYIARAIDQISDQWDRMTSGLGGAIAQVALGTPAHRLESTFNDLIYQSCLDRFIEPLFWFLLTDEQRREVSVFYTEALNQTERYSLFSDSWMIEQQNRIESLLAE